MDLVGSTILSSYVSNTYKLNPFLTDFSRFIPAYTGNTLPVSV
jgi:hypothetical protein